MKPLFQAVVSVVVFASAVGCGDPFFVEVEAPRVCERTQALTFETVELPPEIQQIYDQNPNLAPSELPIATMQKRLEYNLAGALSEDMVGQVETSIALQQVSFISATGTPLDFIHEISVYIAPPAGSALEPRKLLAYKKPENASDASLTELIATSDANTLDLRAYADGGMLYLDSSLTAAWPEQGATMDVGACVSMTARSNYLE